MSPAAEEHRRAVISGLAAFLRQAVEQAFGPWARDSIEVELIARALIGAAQELLVAHVRGELGLSRAELVENLTRLFLTAGPLVTELAGESQTPSEEHP